MMWAGLFAGGRGLSGSGAAGAALAGTETFAGAEATLAGPALPLAAPLPVSPPGRLRASSGRLGNHWDWPYSC